MKKLFALLLTGTLLFSLAACGSSTSSEAPSSPSVSSEQASSSSAPAEPSSAEAETETSSIDPQAETANALVVYFSATGNTQLAAEALAEQTGADLFQLVPEQPYTDEDLDYSDDSTRATMEQNDEAARPAISGEIGNMDSYDVIYVGFPIWWGDMPRILYTFFDSYDLSGKTIAPFCTSGGSGISRATQTIEELEPSATVTEGLQTSASNAGDDLAQWLSDIGLA